MLVLGSAHLLRVPHISDRNIYGAFDAASEDEIYDLLATSVDTALLDELYGEIYESLILRSEGGAVCRIEE